MAGYVQSKSDIGGALTFAQTFSSAVTAHNLLVCDVLWNPTGGAGTISVSDSVNGAWTAISTRFVGTGGNAGIYYQQFYLANTAAGTPTVTATVSATSNSGCILGITEVSGMSTTAPLDGTNFSYTNVAGNNPSTASITPSINGCYVHANCNPDTGATAIGSPFTQRETFGGAGTLMGDYLQTTAASISASFTATASDNIMALVSYKPAVVTNASVTPSAIACTATVPAPTIAAGAVATPVAVAALATVPAPAVRRDVALTPAAVAAVATVPNPAIVAGNNANVTPNPATATVTVFGPIVAGSAFPTPAAVAAVATVPAPAVSAGSTLVAAAVAAVATVPAVTVTAGLSATAAPSAVAAVATVPAPSITAGNNVNVDVPAVTAVATVPPLTGATIAVTVAPPAISAVATVPAPTVGLNATATPAAVHAVAFVPTLVPFTGLSAFPAPGPAAAVAFVPIPVITSITGTFTTPAAVTAVATVPIPLIAAGHSAYATPATVNAYATVPIPANFRQVFDFYFAVGTPVDRWFVGDTGPRWAAFSSASRWEAAEASSRWIIPSHGRLTMSQTLSTASLEYVRVPVEATKSGVLFDPTVDAVSMAFQATPAAPSLFYNGAWESTGTTFYALCLVGPGGVVQLTPGTWYTWVKITDNPEIPVLDAGVILVR